MFLSVGTDSVVHDNRDAAPTVDVQRAGGNEKAPLGSLRRGFEFQCRLITIAREVPLPLGTRLEWVGEFQNLQDAIGRLQIAVPLSLALIALLLWPVRLGANFGSGGVRICPGY